MELNLDKKKQKKLKTKSKKSMSNKANMLKVRLKKDKKKESLIKKLKINFHLKDFQLLFHLDQDKVDELMDIFLKEENQIFTLKKLKIKESDETYLIYIAFLKYNIQINSKNTFFLLLFNYYIFNICIIKNLFFLFLLKELEK